MKRVLIVGCAGAGKSTLAVELGELLGLPVVHLDAHFWNAGWIETEREAWAAKVAELVAAERWIMDGNYGGTIDLRVAAADTILFLDFPRRICIPAILRRRWKYRGATRPDLAPGCPEQIDLEFFKWVWNYRRKSGPRILAAIERNRDGKRLEILRSRREVRRFVEELRAGRLRRDAAPGPPPPGSPAGSTPPSNR